MRSLVLTLGPTGTRFPLTRQNGKPCAVPTFAKWSDLKQQHNPAVKWGKVKSVSRSIEKLLRVYQYCRRADVSKLVDVCRQSIVFNRCLSCYAHVWDCCSVSHTLACYARPTPCPVLTGRGCGTSMTDLARGFDVVVGDPHVDVLRVVNRYCFGSPGLRVQAF
eukprot:3180436-Rhodomonas_salina.1